MTEKRKKTGRLALALLLILALIPAGIQTVRWAREHHVSQWVNVRAFALGHGIPMDAYPESILALYDRNPETHDFVLYYPLEHDVHRAVTMEDYEDTQGVPLFLQWDRRWGYMEYGSDVAGLTGCGPVTLAMAGYYLTGGDQQFRPDNMIRFALEEEYCAPGQGTYWAMMDQGARSLGLDAAEILPGRETIVGSLEAGDLVICMMGPGDFTREGHYILLTGIENNRIRINDCNSIANSQRLWGYSEIADQIRGAWAIGREPLPEPELLPEPEPTREAAEP